MYVCIFHKLFLSKIIIARKLKTIYYQANFFHTYFNYLNKIDMFFIHEKVLTSQNIHHTSNIIILYSNQILLEKFILKTNIQFIQKCIQPY